MEFYMIKKLFEDKTIMNPANPQETFTCADLIDGTYSNLPEKP